MSCYEVVRDRNGRAVGIVDFFTKKPVPTNEATLVLAEVERARKRGRRRRDFERIREMARAVPQEEVDALAAELEQEAKQYLDPKGAN